MSKTSYKFVVQIDSTEDAETTRTVLQKLIDIGLSDAADTLENEEYNRELHCDEAEIALNIDIHAPVLANK